VELLARRCISIDGDRNGALFRAHPGDSRADAFRATGHEHNFVLELEVHGERGSGREL
jgi:hypothetical protein